jgi:hypothetical protein
MCLIQYQIEKGNLLELLDFIPKLLIANDYNIIILCPLDYFSFLLCRPFINCDAYPIKVFPDFIPPVIRDRSGTYYEIKGLRLSFGEILASEKTFIKNDTEGL